MQTTKERTSTCPHRRRQQTPEIIALKGPQKATASRSKRNLKQIRCLNAYRSIG